MPVSIQEVSTCKCFAELGSRNSKAARAKPLAGLNPNSLRVDIAAAVDRENLEMKNH